jgi:hypothetical protein
MLLELEDMKGKSYDCLSFLPGQAEGLVSIEGGEYCDDGVAVGGSKLGDIYHITLVKDLPCGNVHFDNFEAILTDPLVYMSNLIESGWYGIIHKKTTTSQKINDGVVKTLKPTELH